MYEPTLFALCLSSLITTSNRRWQRARRPTLARCQIPRRPSAGRLLHWRPFFFFGPLKKARRVKLPITAAFHAPHLGTPDIERIIAPLSNSHEHYLRKDVAILSTRSGEPIAARTLGEALQHIVLDILQEPLSWSKVVQNILSNLAGQNVVLTSIGPVRAADGLRQKLTSAGINILESDGLEPLQALQPENRSSDIAIVGYAARLPESETLEDVWKILEDGRDVHKK